MPYPLLSHQCAQDLCVQGVDVYLMSVTEVYLMSVTEVYLMSVTEVYLMHQVYHGHCLL